MVAAAGATLMVVGCAGDAQLEAALDTITAEELAADIQVLSSDAFEGARLLPPARTVPSTT